jgi:hypothetical protein
LLGQDFRSVEFRELIMPVEQVLSPPNVEDLIREEQQQREELQRQIEEERQRAQTERQRAERLAQRLREMGIDPDTV